MHAIILIFLFKIRTILPLYHFEDLKKKKLFRIITVFGLKINHCEFSTPSTKKLNGYLYRKPVSSALFEICCIKI